MPKKNERDPRKEYPDQTPVSTPIRFRGRYGDPNQVRAYIEEWSRTQAENAHVETIEEANDFDINDPDDDDFFPPDFTPYELHEMQIDSTPDDQALAENNETDDPGAPPTTKDQAHEQSAPVEDSPSLHSGQPSESTQAQKP